MKMVTKEKAVEHPLEDIFDIESGTTIVEYNQILPAEVVPMPNYDQKDDEIEGKLEEIFTVALTNVAVISDEMEKVEGKYKARIGEVTATMLNVALGAVREKASMKQHKDKLTPGMPAAGSKTVNNNIILADRNELIKMMMDNKKKQNEST
jgi:hypothetical protein